MSEADKVYAVIDVGSNSVRLLLTRSALKPSQKIIETTQLAEGLSAGGVLKPEAIKRTALAVRSFYFKALESAAAPVIFATEAVRAAANGGEFCHKVKELCGAEVRVLTGAEEAELGFLGACASAEGSAFCDIGGASTEIAFGGGGKIDFSKSFPIGAVRLTEAAGGGFAEAFNTARAAFKGLPPIQPRRFYSVGGTAGSLAFIASGLNEYSAERLHGFKMDIKCVSELAKMLFSMPETEIALKYKMHSLRARVLPCGAALLLAVLEAIGQTETYLSETDNMEGYVIRYLMKNEK